MTTSIDKNRGLVSVKSKRGGIGALLDDYPVTALPLRVLAETLLRTDRGGLSPLHREIIAANVSQNNNCTFCHNSHLAIAQRIAAETGEMTAAEVIRYATRSIEDLDAPSSDVLVELLRIAEYTRRNNSALSAQDFLSNVSPEVTQDMSHDTILIAAAFCMFNRYVNAGNPGRSTESQEYTSTASTIVKEGYIRPIPASTEEACEKCA